MRLGLYLYPYPYMTICTIPLGLHHLPAGKQQEELHRGVSRFDRVNLTVFIRDPKVWCTCERI